MTLWSVCCWFGGVYGCLQVSGEDGKDLVGDHSEELITEDLQNIHLVVQQIADNEIAADEETGETVHSSEIKNLCFFYIV